MNQGKIRVLIGDIFKSKAQTLVNTVNCVGVMGKGLALEFKKHFPDMFKDYTKQCEANKVQLGQPYLYKQLTGHWILLFPTKQHWSSVSNIKDIKEGLDYLAKHYRDWGITSIAVPPLGCGLGELNWDIVGPTLYRGLLKLDIPIELYAPTGTSPGKLIPEFLTNPSESQLVESSKRPESRIDPGFITIVEVLRKLELIPYHWSVGRVIFQKIAYFGTVLGLETGLTYYRGSFGPFSSELKSKLTKLLNNGLIKENHFGNMFMIKVGDTFKDASDVYKKEINSKQDIIEKVVDLFCRMNTGQAEMAATVHFAYSNLKNRNKRKPSEEEILNEVLVWKKRHKPPLKSEEIAKTIRNLAILGWVDVVPSDAMPDELDIEPSKELLAAHS